jgi:hypothetical protein
MIIEMEVKKFWNLAGRALIKTLRTLSFLLLSLTGSTLGNRIML